MGILGTQQTPYGTLMGAQGDLEEMDASANEVSNSTYLAPDDVTPTTERVQLIGSRTLLLPIAHRYSA